MTDVARELRPRVPDATYSAPEGAERTGPPALAAVPGKLSLLEVMAGGLIASKVPGRQPLPRPLPTGGRDAPEAIRRRVEAVTGADLSGVRVHDGGAAAEAAAALGARAFTIGRDVYFGRGELAPGTASGDHLLAHELGHAAQQRGGAVRAQARLEIGAAHDPAEHEADAIADAAAAPGPIAARIAPTPGAPAVRMVRLTGDQAAGFVAFDDDVSRQLYFPSKAIEPQPGPDDRLNALESSVAKLDKVLAQLDLLTQDETTEPEAATSESKQVDLAFGDLREPFDGAATMLKELTGRFPDGARGNAVLAAIEQIADRAQAIRDRARRAMTHHKSAKTKRDNEAALALLSKEAQRELPKHHGTSYDTKLKVGNEQKTWTVGSIDQSLEHLARTGRLAELVDVLMELFAKHEAPKEKSAFHGDFFGTFGGKDRLDKLIASALHNVAHPETIFQGDQNTCAGAVLEMLIAIQEPAAYLKLVMQVASGKAELVLRDKSKIQPTGKPGRDDGSLRNPASQLVQPAMMEAMRPGEGYDAKTDRYLASTGKDDQGVSDDNLVHGSGQVLAAPLAKGGKSYGPSISSPQVATVRHSGKSHQIIAIETDGKFAYLLNPQWGRPERMAIDEWRKLEVQLFTGGGSDPVAQFRHVLQGDRSTWKLVTAVEIVGL